MNETVIPAPQLAILAGLKLHEAAWLQIPSPDGGRTDLSEGVIWNRHRKTFIAVEIAEGRVREFSADAKTNRIFALGDNRRIGAALLIRGGGGKRLFILSDAGSFILDLESGEFNQTRRDFPIDLSLGGIGRPNDAAVNQDGVAFVSTISNNGKLPCGQILRYDGANNLISEVQGGMRIPNGLCFNEDTLYWVDSAIGIMYRRRISGKFYSANEIHCDSTALLKYPDAVYDGSTVLGDCRVVAAAWGIGHLLIHGTDGALQGRIETPVSRPTCVAFGGDQLDTVAITSERDKNSPESGGIFVAKIEGLTGRPENEMALR